MQFVTRIARSVTLAAVALGALLASSTSALGWAYAPNGTAGSPGAVTWVSNVQAADLYVGGVTGLTFLNNTGPVANRSQATTGAQDVTLVYSVQQWNGSAWVQVTQQRTVTRIGAGVASVRLPALYVRPTVSRGYFRIVHVFQWNVAGTASVVGGSVIIPDRASDHVCTTPHRPCAAYAGYVRLGRQYAVGGGW
jgi:hypothetical protein